MKTILTSIIILASIAVSAPADAHPHHGHRHVKVADSRLNVPYVWVWVPSPYVYGASFGDWYRVRRGSYFHRVYGNYHPPRRHYRRR